LLVVWFAGTVQPGWLDHSTWPVAGRWFVRLERIAFCAIGGSAFSALRRSCSSRTSRSTGTLVPGWLVCLDPAGLDWVSRRRWCVATRAGPCWAGTVADWTSGGRWALNKC